MDTLANKQTLTATLKQLFACHRGLLAMDESTPTCNARFAAEGIPQTVEMRRSYRELLVTTPNLSESISGAILFDETIRQKTVGGVPFVKVLQEAGIVVGIKVDTGANPLAGHPGEKVTEGLDGLRERLAEYGKMGARFAKWRAVFTIGDGRPTATCIDANVHALARYAALCQEAGIVPIVEPEVLMAGNHGLQEGYRVTEKVLKTLFYRLYEYGVDLEGVILKPNMVTPGTDHPERATDREIAEQTVHCLLASVPASAPAIAFLSGGQSTEEAAARLHAMHAAYNNHLPWVLTFSFGRAIQQPALKAWAGQDAHSAAAQKILYADACRMR